MAILHSTLLLFVSLCGHGALARFVVFRGGEVSQLENFTNLERLEVAARSGETHIVELTEATQGGVVQGDVSLNIDCLSWLNQNSDGSGIRWFFIQLDESGNIKDPTVPPLEVLPNEHVMPRPRIVVGGEHNRWLNITPTVSIQGAGDPDSKIFMCTVCKAPDCSHRNISRYTQLTVGSPPEVWNTSDELCISARDSKVVALECEIHNNPQPNPTRSWFKDGELVYSVLSGTSANPRDYYMKYPILSLGVLQPTILSATRDGTIYFNYEVKNITNPDELPNTTIKQAQRIVLEHLVGNWTCTVNNTFGSAISITYIIIDQCIPRFGISPTSIAVSEDTPHVEICIHVETKLFRNVVVTARIGQTIGVTHQATANSDYRASATIELLTFTPSDQVKCTNIPIIDDDINEPDEYFSMTLTSATPFGNFSNATAVITIIDNDHMPTPGESDTDHELIMKITPPVITLTSVIVVIMTVSIGCWCYHRKKRKREDLRCASSEGRLVINVSLLDHAKHCEENVYIDSELKLERCESLTEKRANEVQPLSSILMTEYGHATLEFGSAKSVGHERPQEDFTPLNKMSGCDHLLTVQNVINEEADKNVNVSIDHDYEDLYWEPANREEELMAQLSKLGLPVILSDNIQLKDYLGTGEFGAVHRGLWTLRSSDGICLKTTEVAVKSVKEAADEEMRVKFLQEAAVMGQFEHPNILRVLGIVREEPMKLVIEIMSKGDLLHHLISLRPVEGQSQCKELGALLLSYSRQIALGMVYLSIKEFVHRDLAARNVLVSDEGVCKIADFGLSRDLQKGDYYVSHGGKIPVKWTAPEALHYCKYSTASDVWSYGCLLYEIWSLGCKPFHDITNAEVS